MHVLIHDYAGHPFQVQLSRALARRGSRVTHLYASMIETPRGSLARRGDDPDGLEIRGVGIDSAFAKHSFVKRRFQEVEYGRRVAAEAERLAPDWVISGNTPTEAQAVLANRCRSRGIGFVSWVQDFYGIAVDKLVRRKLPLIGAAVGAYYKRMDRRVLRQSDRIVVITEDFRPMLDRMHVERERVAVIENWAPLEELPLMPRTNAWSREQALCDSFCFLYSGTLGMKHNPALLLELALRHRDDAGVRVVVISEGLGARWLDARKAEHGLDNLVLLPFQPFERMPEVLASADVLVAILEPDAGVFSVPSKVLTYLCAGKPLLAAMPRENLAARTITSAGAGVVVAPHDVSAFVAAGDAFKHDRVSREVAGASARAYAERTFDIGAITDAFERTLS